MCPRHIPFPAADITKVVERYIELGFNSLPVNDTVAVTDATDLTEGEVTVELPEGAVVKKASLLGMLIYQQNETTQIDVDVDVFLAKSADAYGDAVLSLSPGFGLPSYKGTSGELVVPVDVSAKVDAAGDYKCQIKVTQSEANSVKYVSSFILIVSYSMA